MRVLVTGHLGYIGTIMTPMLLREGFDVVGLDTDLYRRCTFGDGIVEVPHINKDIRDVVAADLAGFDAVFHLAGLSNDPLGDLDPQLTRQVNHEASVSLAELAKSAGVGRFVFSSSCSTYGAAGEGYVTEQSAFNPVTHYGESKVNVELDVSELANGNFSPTFLRNATAYGMSPRVRFDLVLNNLVAWACTTGKVMLKSDGCPWRPLVHIEDISRAFIAVLRAPRDRIHNRSFNIGITSENYRIRDIAAIVQETVPGSEIAFAEGASSDARNYRVDCGKALRTLPDFRPQWNVRRGARQLYEAYKRIGLTIEECEGSRYQRLSHIRMLIAEGVLQADLRQRPDRRPVAKAGGPQGGEWA